MKKIILCFVVVLFCLAACKKTEETARVRFAQTEFVIATKYKTMPYILYQGKKYSGGWVLTSVFGDKNFEFYKNNGEKVTNFKLTIAGSQKYYIYQPDSTTVPVLLTELPPPPPPPPVTNPLEGSTAAPAGYVQIRVRNNAKEALPFENLDVVLQGVTGYDATINRDIVVPLATFSLTGFDYNTDFFLYKKNDGYSYFKFSFTDHDSGKAINDASGYLYVDVFGFPFVKQQMNNYAIELGYYETTDPQESKMAILRNGKYYIVFADMLFQQ